MSRIDDVKKLRELEQAAKGMEIYSNEYDAWEDSMMHHAPAMLDVLGGFRAGDATKLQLMLKNPIDNFNSNEVYMLIRFQKMAALMEKEEQ